MRKLTLAAMLFVGMAALAQTIRTSDIAPNLQLECLGMSANHRYITGLNVGTYCSFVWDTETDAIVEHNGDHANSDFRGVTNDGVAYGILSPDGSEDFMDVHSFRFGQDGIAQPVEQDGAVMSQVFAVTPDGSVAVGCLLDEMWLPTPCVWKDGERQMLPLPSSQDCGFGHDGACAQYVSADGKVIAGYLQDWYSSRPAIIWRQQADGTYVADVVSKEYFGEGKSYNRFMAQGISGNGKWLCIDCKKISEEAGLGGGFMARMNLETGELTEAEYPDFISQDDNNFWPTSIADDGTCIGVLEQFDGYRQGLIWKGDATVPQLLSEMLPELEILQDYDFFMNNPVAISADGKYIAGYGCPITFYPDGPDYDFQSYLISIDGATGIANIKTHQLNNNRIYNISGQRVSHDFRGIIIRDGKKTIN